MFVLLTELPAASIQFVLRPTVRALVWDYSRQPWPAGQERLRVLPLTLLVSVAGVTEAVLTTLNTPFVKLKAVAPLALMLAKLPGFVAPAPLNKVNVWLSVKVPLGTILSTPP